MIGRIIEACVGNKLLTLLLALLAAGAGFLAMSDTPLDAIPDLSDVQVIVYTEYPGQAPQVVEDQVTFPLSTAMLAVPYARAVRGYSFFGLSFVYVIFEDGTDIYWARSRVLEYLNFAGDRLPEGVLPRLGPDATGVGWVYEYALVDTSGRLDLAELRSIQDWYLRYELTSVPGVAEVASIGGFVKQYQVTVDPNKLLAYGIPLQQVRTAIQRSNRDVGGRLIELAETEFMVRGLGYIRSLEDIGNVPVSAGRSGTPVRVRDVATVQVGPELRRGLAEWNGEGEVAGGIVVMRYGENALEGDRRRQGETRRARGRPAGRGGGGDRLRPLRPHPPRRRPPAGEADRGVPRGRRGMRALPPSLPQRLRRRRHPAPGHPDLLHRHVGPGHQRQHHVARGDRHRRRRHGRRRHRADRERPPAPRAGPRPQGALGDHRRLFEGGGAGPVLLAADRHPLLPAGFHPGGAGGAAVQAAGLHQDLRHGRRRHPVDHGGAGADRLLPARPPRRRRPQSPQPPADPGVRAGPRLAAAPQGGGARRGRGGDVRVPVSLPQRRRRALRRAAAGASRTRPSSACSGCFPSR